MVIVMDPQQAVSFDRGDREAIWDLWEMPKKRGPIIVTGRDSGRDTGNSVHVQRRNELPTTKDETSIGPRGSLSAILSAYGIACNIASQLDRNTQHALSLSCREIHETMKTSRKLMARQSLKCFNDCTTRVPGKSEKKSSCARDLVAHCIKCSQPVCRNCIFRMRFVMVKEYRHQRLCLTCTDAPLEDLQFEIFPPPPRNTVAHHAFMTRPCNCEDIAWVCSSCGPRLLEKDRQYMTSWEWIRRYSETMEGIIEQGKIRCARGERCLASETILIEVDSDAVDRAGSASPKETDTVASRGIADEQAPVLPKSSLPNRGPGYFRQEIMGIGGVIKQKSWQNLTVGGLVTFFGDFFTSDRCGREGMILEGEKKGERRSWCGWCDGVIPAKTEQWNSDENEVDRAIESCRYTQPHQSEHREAAAKSTKTEQDLLPVHPKTPTSGMHVQRINVRNNTSSTSRNSLVQPNWSADYLDDSVFLDTHNISESSSSSRPHNAGLYGCSDGSRSQRDLVNSLSNLE